MQYWRVQSVASITYDFVLDIQLQNLPVFADGGCIIACFQLWEKIIACSSIVVM
jgi:hypothetical protein